MSLRVAVVTLLLALTACAKANVAGEVDAAIVGGDGDAAVDAPAVTIDASTTCVRSPCNILPQCGCEATPATPVCDLDSAMLSTGATRCRANMFQGRETTICSFATTCDTEHVCVGGRCRHYCDDDDDCPGAGGLCIIDLTQGNPAMPIPMAPKTCTTDCVPSSAANPTCPTGWACHVYQHDPNATVMGDERYLSDCNAPPASGGGVGQTCTNNSSCQPGLDCVTLNPGGNQCRPNCLCPGGNCAAGMCPGGSGTCRPFTPAVVIGAQTYGTCF